MAQVTFEPESAPVTHGDPRQREELAIGPGQRTIRRAGEAEAGLPDAVHGTLVVGSEGVGETVGLGAGESASFSIRKAPPLIAASPVAMANIGNAACMDGFIPASQAMLSINH